MGGCRHFFGTSWLLVMLTRHQLCISLASIHSVKMKLQRGLSISQLLFWKSVPRTPSRVSCLAVGVVPMHMCRLGEKLSMTFSSLDHAAFVTGLVAVEKHTTSHGKSTPSSVLGL